MNTSKAEQQKRFRHMGLVFIALAALFSAGAYFFPADWFFLSFEDKESFYMVSVIFIAAGIYCLKS